MLAFIADPSIALAIKKGGFIAKVSHSTFSDMEPEKGGGNEDRSTDIS